MAREDTSEQRPMKREDNSERGLMKRDDNSVQRQMQRDNSEQQHMAIDDNLEQRHWERENNSEERLTEREDYSKQRLMKREDNSEQTLWKTEYKLEQNFTGRKKVSKYAARFSKMSDIEIVHRRAESSQTISEKKSKKCRSVGVITLVAVIVGIISFSVWISLQVHLKNWIFWNVGECLKFSVWSQ